MGESSSRRYLDAETLGLLVLAAGVATGVVVGFALPRDVAHLRLVRLGSFAAIAIVTGFCYRYVVADLREEGTAE